MSRFLKSILVLAASVYATTFAVNDAAALSAALGQPIAAGGTLQSVTTINGPGYLYTAPLIAPLGTLASGTIINTAVALPLVKNAAAATLLITTI